MNQRTLSEKIQNGGFDESFNLIYPCVSTAKERYCGLLKMHEERFGIKDDISLFSTPGRTEISGNHTDHQHGRVLAGSINLDVIAAVSQNDDNIIRIKSVGHDEAVVDLSDLSVHENEKGSSPSLIRGVAFKLKDMGMKLGGFDAYTTSDVLAGSGLSSSAAFEVLVAEILNSLFNDEKLSAVELAKISQFAEREYFGKPSGLMDQTACAVGGCVEIDFEDNANPVISAIGFDLASYGYKLIITNAGASHADLIDDYASVPRDMLSVAAFFKKSVLREVDKNEFFKSIKKLRTAVGDKAVLRAIHFFEENDRLCFVANALRDGDIEKFFSLVKMSGKSSYERLQNVYSDSAPNEQSLSIALALSEQILGDRGAYRVHGGGFAGTIQAFVPDDLTDIYVETIENVFEKGACHILNIRSKGAIRIF